MKVQIFSILAVFFVQIASAQSPIPPTIAKNMDSINALVKSVSKNVNDSSQNVSSAAAAGQIVTLFTTVLAQMPDSVKSLPATQQSAAMSGYQALIQKEIADAQALVKAFAANNNAGASSILQDMNTIKSQGHSTYAK